MSGNVASYTKELMRLIEKGQPFLRSTGYTTVSRDRSRVYNAARRAGWKVSTYVTTVGTDWSYPDAPRRQSPVIYVVPVQRTKP